VVLLEVVIEAGIPKRQHFGARSPLLATAADSRFLISPRFGMTKSGRHHEWTMTAAIKRNDQRLTTDD
jgi:hypothetical protein